jgi:hypothetical protein
MYLDKMKNPESDNTMSTSSAISVNKAISSSTSMSKTKDIVNYNPTLYTQQQGQCAMCGDMKSSHPDGCPKQGIICNACERPNHGLLFCNRIKKDVKKSSDIPTFPSKGKRLNNKTKDYKDSSHSRKRHIKSNDSESSEEKVSRKNKINVTKHSPTHSDNDAMDFHVFVTRAETSSLSSNSAIFDPTFDYPYWQHCPTPSLSVHDFDANSSSIHCQYFPYESAPSSPCPSYPSPTPLDLYRAAHPEYADGCGEYLDVHNVIRKSGHVFAGALPST